MQLSGCLRTFSLNASGSVSLSCSLKPRDFLPPILTSPTPFLQPDSSPRGFLPRNSNPNPVNATMAPPPALEVHQQSSSVG